MKPWLALSLLLITNACVPPEVRQLEFETTLSAWVGRPVKEFIALHGLPTHVAKLPGGNAFYLYARSRSQPNVWNYTEYVNYSTGQRVVQGSSAQAPGWMNDGGAQHVATRDRSFQSEVTFYCRIHLQTGPDGVILSTRFEGNDCW